MADTLNKELLLGLTPEGSAITLTRGNEEGSMNFNAWEYGLKERLTAREDGKESLRDAYSYKDFLENLSGKNYAYIAEDDFRTDKYENKPWEVSGWNYYERVVGKIYVPSRRFPILHINLQELQPEILIKDIKLLENVFIACYGYDNTEYNFPDDLKPSAYQLRVDMLFNHYASFIPAVLRKFL